MNPLFNKIFARIRQLLWATIVAYMLGIHNFYKGEEKSPENIVSIELNEEQEKGSS